MEKIKLTTGDKALKIIQITKVYYYQISKIEESNTSVINQLKEELEKKIIEIIKM